MKTVEAPSDHKAILFDFILSNPDSKMPLRIPNKKLAEKLTNEALVSTETLREFLTKHKALKTAVKEQVWMEIKKPKFSNE